MNKIIIIGNLTRDPQFNQIDEKLVCKFSVAVSRRYNFNETDYFPVTVWGKMADNCNKFLQKGSKVAVSGALYTRSYEAQDGSKRFAIEITADEVQFLNTKQNTPEQAPIKGMTPVSVDDDEELPF